ncbi:MAG TPA: hypothetical protein VGI91_12810 [Steroidobacteraceae bacterium]
MELMLDECDGNYWVFRRQPAIKRPLAAAIRRNSQGIPYLAPEIQLLYKARTPRAQDQSDFRRFAPQLDPDGHAWLRDALANTDAGHEWISVLDVMRPP